MTMALAPALLLAPDQAPSPRDHLRMATRQAHDRVDAAFAGFGPDDPAGYRLFLQSHHSVLPVCEAALAAAGVEALLPDWQLRQRAPVLAADLRDLGLQPDFQSTPIPSLAPPEMLGMLYVLEGSRLGGAFLAKRLRANPDPCCRRASRYLRHGEGERFWPTFVVFFNSLPMVREELPEVTRAALRTFDLFAAAATTAAKPQPYTGAVI